MQVNLELPDSEVENLIRKLQKYEDKVLNEVEARITKGGLRVHREARQDILVDTGRARAATVVSWIIDGGKRMGAVVKTDVNYAIYIERRKPYLYKAFAKERVILIRDLETILRRVK